MGNWNEHGSETGGFYTCNLFETKVTKNTSFANEEKKRSDATNELKRYIFYYERYLNHERSGRLAVAFLPKIQA